MTTDFYFRSVGPKCHCCVMCQVTTTMKALAIASSEPTPLYSFVSTSEHDFVKNTYLDLVAPVPLGACGDEKSPSVSVTGDPVS